MNNTLNPNGYTLLNDAPVIKTYTGRWFNVFEPDPESIHIIDIATSLSRQCRFSGHTQLFYSVAQHSIACSFLVPLEHRLAALLHDASEAYLMDIPSPIKKKLVGYKEIEEAVMVAISSRFGFQYPFHESIKAADEVRLVKEWEFLMHPSDIGTMTEIGAYNKFIELFHQYSKNKFINE